jgi:hypothetical protein
LYWQQPLAGGTGDAFGVIQGVGGTGVPSNPQAMGGPSAVVRKTTAIVKTWNLFIIFSSFPRLKVRFLKFPLISLYI